VCSIPKAGAEFLVISLKGFHVWRNGRHGIGFFFLHLPTLYIVHFLLLTPPVYSKNDGGVEMMTKMMSKEFWTEAEAEAERQQVSGLFYLSRHNSFCELAAQQFERLDKTISSRSFSMHYVFLPVQIQKRPNVVDDCYGVPLGTRSDLILPTPWTNCLYSWKETKQIITS
jgi:hypothetical protein